MLPLEHHFQTFKEILQVQCMWPYFATMTAKRMKIQNIFANFGLILEIHLTVVSILDLIMLKPHQEITEQFKAIIENGILIIALVQVGLFRRNHLALRQMEKAIENFRVPCDFQSCDLFTIEQLRYRYRQLHGVCFMFTFVVCAANTTNTINCLILLYTKGKRTLPQDSWYPFDAFRSPTYEILMLLQFVGQLFMGQVYSNVFIYFLSVSIMIYNQLRILNQYLRNILNETLMEFGINLTVVQQFDFQINELLHERTKYIPKTMVLKNMNILYISSLFEAANLTFNPYDFDEKLYEKLKNCIKHHQAILTAAKILQDTMQPLFFLNMCLTTGFISIFLFLLIYISNMQNMLTFIQYMYLEVIAWFAYGFLGSLLTFQSEKVTNAVYEMPWYLLTKKKFLMSMKFMLMRSFKPITITAGKVTPVSLELCVMMIRSGFSYYTVLKGTKGINED